MPRLIPFSHSFLTTDGTQGTKRFKIGGRKLRVLTIYVETDNVGPVLVDAYVETYGEKHFLREEEAILDGDGHNSKKYFWSGEYPLAGKIFNYLAIIYSNYCGDDVKIKFTGVVER